MVLMTCLKLSRLVDGPVSTGCRQLHNDAGKTLRVAGSTGICKDVQPVSTRLIAALAVREHAGGPKKQTFTSCGRTARAVLGKQSMVSSIRSSIFEGHVLL